MKSVETPTFGSELRRLRTSRGLSQRQLVERIDCNHSYISRLEAGTRHPSLCAVERLSAALSVRATEEFRLHFAAGYVPRWVIGMELDTLVHILTEEVEA